MPNKVVVDFGFHPPYAWKVAGGREVRPGLRLPEGAQRGLTSQSVNLISRPDSQSGNYIYFNPGI
jgi:hypothetical protein